MIANKLRAVATALVLGSAVLGAVLVSTPAEAAVRAAVGKPLQAAIAAAGAGNYQAAMQSVRQAEAVGGLTGEEQKILTQVKQYIETKSGGAAGVSDAIGAKAKFAADWRSRRYRDVIDDAELLRKYGAMDSQSAIVIAQAYYLSGDYHGCARYAGESGGGADMLDLQMRCAYEAHDDAAMRSALEQLVATTGKPQYWSQLLKLAQNAKGLSDQQTLDIYRIKLLTGSLAGADDYFTLAQLALQFGLASEAVSVVQKGMQAKVLVDARAQRLDDLAKKTKDADLANLAKTAAAASAAGRGDLLVKLGENYCGMGRYPDAVAAVQAGIKKGVTDADNAQIRLGQALYGAGQKDAALATFAKASTPNGQVVAHLWSLYARGH